MRWKCLAALRALAAGGALLMVGCGSDPSPIDGDAGVLGAVDGAAEVDAGRMVAPPGTQPTGSNCSCDSECAGDDAHPGVCVFGICMTRASADCASGGSTAECGAGSRCWFMDGGDVPICWPDCASFECMGQCDGDGSCAPAEGDRCDPACGSVCGPPACSPTAPTGVCAGADQACVEGACVDACSATNASGWCPTGQSCEAGTCVSASGCATWMCSGPDCAELELMPGSSDPDSPTTLRLGYYLSSPERYSWLRHDLVLIFQYAVCETNARFPGTTPLATGDLSQMDALTPGVDDGRPRHPTTTHTGSDLDLAYYQTDGANNYQIVCGDGSDRNGNGNTGTYNDGYFCTTDTNVVDFEREAYFFAMMASSPLARVFGVDTTFAEPLRAELVRLRDAGEITATQLEGASSLGFGSEGGWAFHHHHSHMSYSR